MKKVPELSKLSIIKPTRELIKFIANYTKNMPKEYKLPYGNLLANDSLELLNAISLANNENNILNKSNYISNIVRLSKKIEIMISILSDLKLIGNKQEANIAKLLVEIGKQSTNWYNKIISLMSDQEKV